MQKASQCTTGNCVCEIGFQVPPDPILLCDISSLWAAVFSPVKWEG